MNSGITNSPIRQWFIGQSLNHSKRTIILSIIATLIMGSGVRFLIIDDDMMKMLPKDLNSKITWDAVQDEFGSTEIIFIAFGRESESVFKPQALADLWSLSEELETLSSVDDVISISTATRIDNIDGFMEIDDLQIVQTLTDAEIDEIKIYLGKNPNIKKQLVSKGEDYLLTIVQPYDDVGLDTFRNDIVTAAESILNNYQIHFGGTAYITGSVPQLIREDVQSLIKAGILIMVVILLLNLRSLSGVIMVLMVIGFSLVSMMGFMGWIYSITGSDRFLFALLNTSMPIILLTIANSDGVHVVTKFFREMRVTKDVNTAVATTMDSLLIPIFLTSITTIAAFLTMISSPLEPLVGYGICISVGIGWAWFLSSLMLPAVISLKKWDHESRAIAQASVFEVLIGRLGEVVLKYPKYVFSTGLFLVFFGLAGLYKITVDVNVASFFKPGTEIRDSMDFMDQEMTGTMDLRIRVEGDIKDPDILRKMDSLQVFVEKNNKIAVTYSIADVVKQMHRTVMDDSLKYESIPTSREKVNNLFTMYSMSGDPDDFSAMIDYDYTVGLITALSTVMTTEEVFSFVVSVSNYITTYFNENLNINVTGMIVVIRDMVIMIIQSSSLSILFSLILIGIIASIFFKRILWGFLAVVPLTAAVILNFGLMGHFNVTLNHITAILSSIIIGVGVDFAIHFISQFRRLSQTTHEDQLSLEVIKDVGYPIILDAGSNMGFGALLFSAFVPVQYIGGLMVFAMISTSMGTLTLLSSTAELLKHRLIEKEN